MSSILYFGDTTAGVHRRKNGISISLPNEDKEAKNKRTYSDPVKTGEELLDKLAEAGVRFAVDQRQVNKKWSVNEKIKYNDVIFDAGILNTRMKSTRRREGYVYMHPINSERDMDEIEKYLEEQEGETVDTSVALPMAATSLGTVEDEHEVIVENVEKSDLSDTNDLSQRSKNEEVLRLNENEIQDSTDVLPDSVKSKQRYPRRKNSFFKAEKTTPIEQSELIEGFSDKYYHVIDELVERGDVVIHDESE
jgi:hypothetical protein